MRTTLILNDELIREAQRLTKVKEKTSLVNMGLKALIEQFARKRLIALAGKDRKAKAPRRRRIR